MLKKIKINNDFFSISNKVYKEEFNLSKEINRYNLIKKFLSKIPRYNDLIYMGLCYGNFSDDPFLVKIDLDNPKIYNKIYKWEINLKCYPKNNIYKYNSSIKKIKKILKTSKKIKIILDSKFENDFLTISWKNLSFNIYLPSYCEENKEIIFALLLRYYTLQFLNNNSLAVTPEIYNELKDQNYNVELFASFFNRKMTYYFGLFYDLEYSFGCLGNILTAKLKKGNFVANPPFYISLMNNFYKRLKQNLDKFPIKVYITVPTWYIPDRIEYNKTHTDKLNTNYKNDIIKNILEKYIISNNLYSKNEYKFYDYINNKYIHLTEINVFIVNSKIS